MAGSLTPSPSAVSAPLVRPPLVRPHPRIPYVHIMCGLPGSGKTTAARRLVAEHGGLMRRVNLDDLRAMMDQGTGGRPLWSNAHEQVTLAVHDSAVREAVLGGYDVVVDNTNLTSAHPLRLKTAVGRLAWFVVHDLTGVPTEECIRRDAARPDPLGADVIRLLARQHAEALNTGWQLTEAWMNDSHDAAADGARWARQHAERMESEGAAR